MQRFPGTLQGQTVTQLLRLRRNSTAGRLSHPQVTTAGHRRDDVFHHQLRSETLHVAMASRPFWEPPSFLPTHVSRVLCSRRAQRPGSYAYRSPVSCRGLHSTLIMLPCDEASIVTILFLQMDKYCSRKHLSCNHGDAYGYHSFA